MGRKIFLDIETLPPDEDERRRISVGIVRKLERRPPSVTDERGDDGVCTDEEFRRLALYGEYGRVLTIGVIVERDGAETHRGVFGRERQTMMFHLDEARTLRGFWKLLKNFNVSRDLIIGHNILEFDLPFIYKRSMIHGVEPSVELSFARYRRQPIYDTMREWAHWDSRRNISLSDLARVLKIEMMKTEGLDGSLIYDRFCAGCHDEIARYCLRDVEMVRAIYRRMTFAEREINS
jgi:3'-5' exonuclease